MKSIIVHLTEEEKKEIFKQAQVTYTGGGNPKLLKIVNITSVCPGKKDVVITSKYKLLVFFKTKTEGYWVVVKTGQDFKSYSFSLESIKDEEVFKTKDEVISCCFYLGIETSLLIDLIKEHGKDFLN